MKVELINYTPPEVATLAMSKCYGKECALDSLINACKAGHWSLLEHIIISMDIECSQKVLAQITRHRHFSFTVQSTRGMDITDNGFFIDFNKLNEMEKSYMKQAYSITSLMFKNLLSAGISFEVASYALPLGTNVKMVATGNLRCWLEYLKQRLCKRASDEHQQLARAIYKRLQFAYPKLCNLEMLGMCESCKELSCDFTSHKKKQKEPVRKELQ